MREKIKKVIEEILKQLDFESIDFEIKEPPKNINFDFSTNLPILLSKKYNIGVDEVFKKIENLVDKNYKNVFLKLSLSSPGFLNFDISNEFYYDELKNILFEKENYPILDKYKNKKVLIEFVSANPTGPLHIGHGRCAVLGDVLGNILKKLGCELHKEYYINDRGRQIDILTASVISVIAENSLVKVDEDVYKWSQNIILQSKYKGDYIKDIAYKISNAFNEINFSVIGELKKKIVNLIMENIKDSLKNLRVFFDNFKSEEELYNSQLPDKIKYLLEKFSLLEKKDSAIWVKATNFGDNKDRVIIKSDGQPTYFFSDIVYHYDKLERGYQWLINIWGTDHHGYVERLKGTIELIAKNLGIDMRLDIILYQLVSLMKNGERISMSTREGKFISLDEVLKEVGVDVTRFFLLTKSPNAHLDFDMELAKENSLKNPVYYIQYAHTRCASILREASKLDKSLSVELYIEELKKYILNLNKDSDEFKLIKALCLYPSVLIDCVENFSPHYLCNYLIELSKVFHRFYETYRVIDSNKINYSRLLLVFATKVIMNNSLLLLNIEAPEKM